MPAGYLAIARASREVTAEFVLGVASASAAHRQLDYQPAATGAKGIRQDPGTQLLHRLPEAPNRVGIDLLPGIT